MPRRRSFSNRGFAYHVLNRRIGRLQLFESPADYLALKKIVCEAHDRTDVHIAAYCLMPNHWHIFVVAAKTEASRADTTILPISPELQPATHRKFRESLLSDSAPFSARPTHETQQSSLSQFASRPAGAEAERLSWKYSFPLW
jgi:REP element-mobilizing transposase RayT